MVVQHNLTAMNSNRMLGITTGTQAKSTEKLSSGYKINRAADDAAGLSISEKMRKQIRGLTQASLNAEDGISAVQTAEGALNEVQDMLQRMNELAVKAANGTMSENDRSYIQDEIKALETEIDRVAETTKFNETYLLKGDKGETATDYKYKASGASLKTTAGVDIADGVFYEKDGDTPIDASKAKEVLAAGGKLYTNAKPAAAQADSAATVSYAAATKAFTKITATAGQASEKLTVGTVTDIDVSAVTDVNSLKETIANAVGDKYDVTIDNTDVVVTAKTEGAGTITVTGNLGGSAVTATPTAGKDEKYTGTFTNLYAENGMDALSEADAKAAVKNGDTLYTVAAGQKEAVEGTNYVFEETALYDKDGNKISANGIQFYHDETGAYTGGLYTDKNGDNEVAVADIGTYVDGTGTKTGALTLKLHVGADATDNNQISVDLDAMSAAGIGVKGLKVDGADDTNARNAIETIKAALQQVSQQRSALGAVQNRLEHTIANLDNVVENTTAAESQIRDTDMATEMVKYSNNNILAQAGQAMLAQANQSNQGVLSLLG